VKAKRKKEPLKTGGQSPCAVKIRMGSRFMEHRVRGRAGKRWIVTWTDGGTQVLVTYSSVGHPKEVRCFPVGDRVPLDHSGSCVGDGKGARNRIKAGDRETSIEANAEVQGRADKSLN
jgi:hypothetical protein